MFEYNSFSARLVLLVFSFWWRREIKPLHSGFNMLNSSAICKSRGVGSLWGDKALEGKRLVVNNCLPLQCVLCSEPTDASVQEYLFHGSPTELTGLSGCGMHFGINVSINSLFAIYKLPVCHIILGRTGIGAPFWKYYFQLAVYLFTCKSYWKTKKPN